MSLPPPDSSFLILKTHVVASFEDPITTQNEV